MSFYYPWAFWFLFIPFALALGEWATRRRRGAADTNSKIIRAEAQRSTLSIRPASGIGGKSRSLVRWRLMLGLALAIVALARPQWGRIEEPVFQQAREIIIALDLSRSMSSTDVKPTRLDRAKLLITSLLGQLKGERVGLVDFAGTAFLQCPLSSDYEILGQFLPQLNPGYMPVEGTDYDALLRTTLDAFGPNDGADRFLILLSDGGADPNDWRKYIPELKAHGIRVIALGIGTAAGSIMPDGAGSFIKDDRGAVVLAKLDASTLRELSAKTGGAYADASAWVDLPKLIQDTVAQGKRGNFEDVGRIRLAERFQWALAPALLFFIWSFWREFPVRPRPRTLRLSGTAPALVIPLLLAMALLALAPRPLVAQTTADADSPSAPVTRLVSQLSTNSSLTAADYATFARTTLDYGSHLEATHQPAPQGPLNDALAAVAAGRALDPKAADWAGLQVKLDALLKQKKSPDQKQNQDQQKQQNQSQKNQSDSSKSDQDSGEKSENQKDQNRQNQNSDKNQSSSSQQNSQQNSQQQNQRQRDNNSSAQPQNSTPQDGQNQGQDNQPQSQNPSGGEQPKDTQSPGSQPQPPQQPAGNQSTQSTPPPQPSQQQSPQSSSSQSAPEPSNQPPSSANMQQVGGAPQKASTSPQDPSLAIPLERLDQVRQSDSPARLFQLMQAQDPNAKPPARTGQNW